MFLVRKQTTPTERPPHVGEVSDRLCGVVFIVPGYRSRGPGFDSRRYQIFWEVVGLERGPLSLVSKIEELFEWKISGFGLENREYGRGDPLRWPRGTLYPQKLWRTTVTSCSYQQRSNEGKQLL
jgi:hypothetical protein